MSASYEAIFPSLRTVKPAYAPPGQVRAAHYEDPPLFASETTPLYGQSIRQSIVGPMFEALKTYLGDQWRIGDWAGNV